MLDYRRAFDKVPFRHMIAKLESHGIDGDLLHWIVDWTTNRQQRVVLNGTHSEWTEVTSSVVQGSVLGPIFFAIFINDLDISINSIHGIFLSKFADDKLGREISTMQDCHRLQAALDDLVAWSKKWGMELHAQKKYRGPFWTEKPGVHLQN